MIKIFFLILLCFFLSIIILFISFEIYTYIFGLDSLGGSTYESKRFEFIFFELLPISVFLVIIGFIVYKKTKSIKSLLLVPFYILFLLTYIFIRIKYIGIY